MNTEMGTKTNILLVGMSWNNIPGVHTFELKKMGARKLVKLQTPVIMDKSTACFCCHSHKTQREYPLKNDG